MFPGVLINRGMLKMLNKRIFERAVGAAILTSLASCGAADSENRQSDPAIAPAENIGKSDRPLQTADFKTMKATLRPATPGKAAMMEFDIVRSDSMASEIIDTFTIEYFIANNVTNPPATNWVARGNITVGPCKTSPHPACTEKSFKINPGIGQLCTTPFPATSASKPLCDKLTPKNNYRVIISWKDSGGKLHRQAEGMTL